MEDVGSEGAPSEVVERVAGGASESVTPIWVSGWEVGHWVAVVRGAA